MEIRENDEGVRRLLIEKEWLPEYAQVMKDEGITWLHLCRTKNLEFLRDMPWLTGLTLYCGNTNVSIVSELENLEKLSIYETTRASYDLSRLKKLRKLCLISAKRFKNIGAGKLLESVRLDNTTDTSFLEMCRSPGIVHLDLVFGTITDLDPLGELSEIKTLRLYSQRKLQNLNALRKLSKLEIVTVESCPCSNDISWLVDKPHLKRVIIDPEHPLDSVEPLLELPSLDHIFFGAKTRLTERQLEQVMSLPEHVAIHFCGGKLLKYSRSAPVASHALI